MLGVCFGFIFHVFSLSYYTIVTSKKAKTVSESTYFGRKVRVLFDDGNTYPGVIVRKDPETNMWVTVFEDGVEDQSADPATDSDYTLLD